MDCKLKSLVLCSDGKLIRNTNLMSGTKLQVFLYNKILTKIQNYQSQHALVVGCNTRYKKSNVWYRSTRFNDRPGIVDVTNKWD